jgi:hypothetical protein
MIESPSFMIFCRRRRRFTLIPNAPIFGLSMESDEDNEEDEEEKPSKHFKLSLQETCLDNNAREGFLDLLVVAWKESNERDLLKSSFSSPLGSYFIPNLSPIIKK